MDNNLVWTKEGFYRLTVLVSVHMNGGIATIKDIKRNEEYELIPKFGRIKKFKYPDWSREVIEA